MFIWLEDSVYLELSLSVRVHACMRTCVRTRVCVFAFVVVCVWECMGARVYLHCFWCFHSLVVKCNLSPKYIELCRNLPLNNNIVGSTGSH